MYANVVYKVHMTFVLRELWRKRSPRALALVILVDRAESVFSKPAAEVSSWLQGSARLRLLIAREAVEGKVLTRHGQIDTIVPSREWCSRVAALEGAGKLGVEHCLEAAGARRVASFLSYVNPRSAGMPCRSAGVKRNIALCKHCSALTFPCLKIQIRSLAALEASEPSAPTRSCPGTLESRSKWLLQLTEIFYGPPGSPSKVQLLPAHPKYMKVCLC